MVSEDELKELKKILKSVFSDYTELAGGKNYRYHHLISVHKYACKLMDSAEVKELDFDREVVEVATLFHDIGRSKDIENGQMNPFEGHEGHAQKGSQIVAEYVEDFVTKKQLEKIEKVIKNHHSTPELVEGKILQDADELFKYGVHGFWRMFHYSCQNERTIKESIAYFQEKESSRLERMLDDFYFDKTRQVARKRLERQRSAMNDIVDELEGDDF